MLNLQKKSKIYLLRNNKDVINRLEFIDDIKYQNKINCIIQYIENDMSDNEYNIWLKNFKKIPVFLTK